MTHKQTINKLLKESKSKDQFITSVVGWMQGDEEQGNLQLKIDPFDTARKIRDLYDHAKDSGKNRKVLISWLAGFVQNIENKEGKKEDSKQNSLF